MHPPLLPQGRDRTGLIRGGGGIIEISGGVVTRTRSDVTYKGAKYTQNNNNRAPIFNSLF